MKRFFWLALIAVVAIAIALLHIRSAGESVRIERTAVEGTPVTIFRPAEAARRPVVVIAHGFAGSQQIMQSFALTFARNGYVAVTFDFLGHGRNSHPLQGNLTQLDGAMIYLQAELARVAAFARTLGDGRLAVLGHSMASDIVVRFAQATPEVAATLAISMFSPAVTATTPANLLIVVGDWENFLKQEALRAVAMAIDPQTAKPGVTYGNFADGSARRTAFSAHVEHASVLYSADSMRESLDWLEQVFGMARNGPPWLDGRGPWLLLLIFAAVLLARPLVAFLPRLAEPPLGAGLSWRHLWLPLLLPMLVTPLLLRVLPTHFLPVVVGDYLAIHFGMYGLLTALCLFWLWRRGIGKPLRSVPALSFALSVLAVIAFGFVALVWPIDSHVTSFAASPQRILLLLTMLVGTLLFFLCDEWLACGQGAGRWAHPASKLAFLVSLGIAVALDFERLFFLMIIVPVIVLFFLVYGLFSVWINRQTGHPFVAGIGNAIAFAWAIGVTFPLVAG